ncbi:NAD-dependent epimerase/dehydratase family protein [Shewanella nanhaiensis]|uniref:SDR family oxidoreductase n=1 Tax=Shewanella nanhaiensis TaxID=2864872 RepID=A0ABS7E688_9GAMM|nr:SDR family oxidoreductase [Shewanella nanhaiensis]MBW8185199.1 SDR family oxidoreductase [Shewanella nanhaiensis]
MKKYTVVGSTGFIGNNLVRFLTEKGEEVTEINRIAPSRNESLGTIVYCAGFGGCDEPQKVLDANLTFLMKLLDECNYERFIYISSTRVYLNATTGTEKSNLVISSGDKRSVFNLSKITAEKLSTNNPKLISLRVSNVYGDAFNSPLFLPTIIRDAIKSRKIKMFTSGDYSKDYINVLDVCNAIYLLSKKEDLSHDVYNIAYSKKVTADEILEEISKSVEHDVEWNTTSVEEFYPEICIKRLRHEINFEPSFVLDDVERMIRLFRDNIDKL